MLSFNRKKLSLQEVQEIVSAKLIWILAHANPDRVILFGSAADGRMSEGSDLDFVLIFMTAEEMNRSKKSLYSASRTDSRPIDLLFYTAEDFERRSKVGGVAFIAATEGKEIFRKETGLEPI